MRTWMLIALIIALTVSFGLTGCSAQTPVTENPPAGEPEPDTSGDAAGLRLANGLYDMEGGKVQALGILDFVDLEGGFWAITDGPAAPGASAKIHAVIANADEIESKLDGLKGKTVSVTGTKFDGASVRQAGPEIIVETIEEISDTPGIAE